MTGPGPSDSSPGYSPALAGSIAAMSGFAVMAIELTAVRLLAPHFGDSAYVWTNVIGVILVALALGAWLGGRMADRGSGSRGLVLVLGVSGALAALVPILARPVAAWAVGKDLRLDAALPALVSGSLLSTLLLFALPILLTGCVTPMLVRLLTLTDSRVGRASGLVGAWSTLGSLGGTFAATHLLVPHLGTRTTVYICAGLLLLAAAAAAVGGRRMALAATALLVTTGLPWLSLGPMRQPLPQETLLAEVESRYQYLQVVETDDPPKTALKINEGLDSFHSLCLRGSPWTNGAYYDYHAVMPYLAGDGPAPLRPRVLSLGAAAGSFARIYAHVHPQCSIDRVEIDPSVHALGDNRRFFPGAKAEGRAFSDTDARLFVNQANGPYDVVLIDTYERQFYIPAHITSRQFFVEVSRILAPGGIASVNVGGTSYDDAVVEALAQTMAAVFGEAMAFRVPSSRNFIVLARNSKPADPTRLAAVRGATDPRLREVLKVMADASRWRRFSSADGGVVLDDDRPYLDVLQERFYAAPWPSDELLPMSGSVDPQSIAERGEELRKSGRMVALLALLRTARGATGYLRFLAGYARWELRDPMGALLEYQAAKALGQSGLDDSLKVLAEEAVPQTAAATTATRNRWLAGLLAALICAGTWLVLRNAPARAG